MYIKHFSVNTEGRDFVIGDLHGSFSCLETALNNLRFNPSVDRIFSVGDLIDRGPDNELCLHLLYESWFHAVKGNHEVMMTHFYNPAKGWYGAVWLNNGGMWGLRHQYDITDESLAIKDLAEIADSLPLLITVDLPNNKKFHVMHAELAESVEMSDSDLADEQRFYKMATKKTVDGDVVLWGRFVFSNLYKQTMDEYALRKFERTAKHFDYHKKYGSNLSMIYSGHTIVKQPTQFMKQTNLDTMAYGSYLKDFKGWEGLTITEPATGKFWKATENSFTTVDPLILE